MWGIELKAFTGGRGSTPDVTSTSTGRMMNWSSLGALVLILIKAVWLSTSLDEKLALITPLVSKGGISWREKGNTCDLNCYYRSSSHQRITPSNPETRNSPITSQCLLVDLWEALNVDPHRWSTSQQPAERHRKGTHSRTKPSRPDATKPADILILLHHLQWFTVRVVDVY